jgi:hypothetical protein
LDYLDLVDRVEILGQFDIVCVVLFKQFPEPEDSNMFQLPSVPNSLCRLQRAGWEAGDVAYHSPSGELVWFVNAYKAEDQISSGGLSQEEAWDEAARKAEAVDWQ